MVQIVGFASFVVSAWFYLRNRFEQNTTALSTVTTTLASMDKKIDRKFEGINSEMKKQNESIIKIEAHGTVMEERIGNLSTRVQAMAGPRR